MTLALTTLYLLGFVGQLVGATAVGLGTPRQPLRRELVLFLLLSACWSLTDAMANSLRDVTAIQVLTNIGALGWTPLPYLVARMAVAYSGNLRLLRSWLLNAPLLGGALTLVALQCSGQLYRDFSPAGASSFYFYSHGTGWIHLGMVYALACVAVAAVALYRAAERTPRLELRRALLPLVVASAASIIAGGIILAWFMETESGLPQFSSLLAAAFSALLVVGILRRDYLTPLESEKRAAAGAIETSERRYRVALEVSPDGIAVTDLDLRLLVANERFAALFGYDNPNSLVKRAAVMVDLLDAESATALRRAAADARRVREPQRHEAVWRFADGRSRQVEVSVGLFDDLQRQDGGFIVVCHDATERTRAETEAHELNVRAQQHQKLESLGALAGSIAHELNNLLVGVLGYASLAEAQPEATPAAREHLRQVGTAAHRATTLTRQLLTYAGRDARVVEEICVASLARECVELWRVTAPPDLAVEVRCAADTPAVHADGGQLQQVVMNLLVNAAEATGGRDGHVILTTSEIEVGAGRFVDTPSGAPVPPGRYALLSVIDNGSGIPPEAQRRVFDPFFSTKFAGRGLGLAAVRGIVHTHGGAVVVSANAAGGTQVMVLLPVATEPIPATPAPEAMPVEPAPKVPPDATVLVIDDEPAVRAVAAAALERAGYRVLTAADGLSGVEAFGEHAAGIVAVILDLTMPRMGGEQTLQRLRELAPAVPVLVTSGYPEPTAAARLGAQPAHFVQKPFTPATLVGAIQACLRPPPEAA
jgi:PAS domain S-box-containing protein